jgi:hypothetical protein
MAADDDQFFAHGVCFYAENRQSARYSRKKMQKKSIPTEIYKNTTLSTRVISGPLLKNKG